MVTHALFVYNITGKMVVLAHFQQLTKIEALHHPFK